MRIKDQIISTMDAYAKAFAAYDADRIAQFWMFPCLVNVRDKSASFENADHFKHNLAGLLRFYQKQGVATAKKRVIDTAVNVPSCLFITTFDQLFDDQHRLITSWNHYYMLRRTKDGFWKIAVSVADEEIDAWASRGTPLK